MSEIGAILHTNAFEAAKELARLELQGLLPAEHRNRNYLSNMVGSDPFTEDASIGRWGAMHLGMQESS